MSPRPAGGPPPAASAADTALAAAKRAARAQARARQAQLSPAYLHAAGLAMQWLLCAAPPWQSARSVFCFCSAPGEPDTRPLLEAALAQGKRLYLPRCLPGQPGQMEAVPLAGLALLRPGAYGIPEPPAGPAAPPEALDLALLPCLAGTPGGVRLGHGGGYYDRFLAGFRGTRVLLCPEALLYAGLPAGPLDVPADFVLTERALTPAAPALRERPGKA